MVCTIEELEDGVEEISKDLPLTPPNDCEKVTGDGGVLKITLEEGHAPGPPRFARCLVHYTGKLADDGQVFMDSRSETQSQQPVLMVAGRTSQPREMGLSLALMTMKLGEKARIFIQEPRYGFGEQGSFSFPAVPPNSKLVYDVELIQWDEPEEDGQEDEKMGGLLFEERLERAERRRVQGNALFSEGKFKAALGKYASALSYMDEDFLMQLEGMYLDKAHEVKLPVHLNMAAAQLQLGDYHTAIYNCSEVLTLSPGHVKALYRRGRARHLLGQTDDALKDLQEALNRAPGDAAVSKELQSVRATIKKERQASAQLFKGQFGASPEISSEQQPVSEAPAEGIRQRKNKEHKPEDSKTEPKGDPWPAEAVSGEIKNVSSVAKKTWWSWLFAAGVLGVLYIISLATRMLF